MVDISMTFALELANTEDKQVGFRLFQPYLNELSSYPDENIEYKKETPFAPLIDATVFSCLIGFRKPNPQIYHLAAKQLVAEPQACLYIGDGSSQELIGTNGVGQLPFSQHLPQPFAFEKFNRGSGIIRGNTVYSCGNM